MIPKNIQLMKRCGQVIDHFLLLRTRVWSRSVTIREPAKNTNTNKTTNTNTSAGADIQEADKNTSTNPNRNKNSNTNT